MINLQRILCPIDLSPESNEALRYAIALARAYDAELLVCHCVEASPLAENNGREDVRKIFEESVLKHRGANSASLPKCEAIVVEDDPETAIPRIAAERFIDLVVMRSRRRPHAASLLGSTAEAISRTAPCPVLVTHPLEREWVGKTTNEIGLRRILVATDFSNDSELSLQYALSLAQEYQAELHVMHVTAVPGVNQVFEQAAEKLRNAVPEEAYLWCQIKHIIRAGYPYREILSYTEENEMDLICMGKHGAGFAMRALFGSNTDRVLRQAPCPVLIARPLKPALPTLDTEELQLVAGPLG
ncbi:MAG TPA: universal stress protein [Blastocatellia bacterium]|nr:universal stress protein [Blastocatellia bacterium]